MYYEKRNLDNIQKLGDNTKVAALKWYDYCKSKGVEILIYETIRTLEQQKQHVANGKSQTLKSYHLVGQALDFVPVDGKGGTLWSIHSYTTPKMLDAINYAKKLGFTWGGDWNNNGDWRDETFLDSPHLQFNYKGYGTDTFGKAPTGSTTSKPTTTPPATSKPNAGNSIVDYLNSLGIDSSFKNRAKLAEQHGIKGYSGTAEQNSALLAKIKASNSKPTAPAKKYTSVVDYLNDHKMDSSFSGRAKLAKKYGIANYTGTAQQNTLLLQKLMS